jgi:two-component system OmpR family sensor kinase
VGSHGGSVRVATTDGGGATFVVSLPLRNEAGDGIQEDREDLRDGDAPFGGKGDGKVIHI